MMSWIISLCKIVLFCLFKLGTTNWIFSLSQCHSLPLHKLVFFLVLLLKFRLTRYIICTFCPEDVRSGPLLTLRKSSLSGKRKRVPNCQQTFLLYKDLSGSPFTTPICQLWEMEHVCIFIPHKFRSLCSEHCVSVPRWQSICVLSLFSPTASLLPLLVRVCCLLIVLCIKI